jgi:hypothetical protein
MGRTASSGSKEKLNKGQIAKIAEEAAKKTVKKTASKVARTEATKVAAKVATEAALNPDYELNDEEEGTSLFGTWGDDGDDDGYEEDGQEDGGSSWGSAFGGGSTRYGDDEDTEEDLDLSKNIKSRDVFAYATDLMNKGTPVRLQIKKNGQFLTTVKKPYSEEELQRDHGEGHYSVVLRNDVKGTFIKQQSFSIAAPPLQAASEIVKIHQEKQEEKIDKMFNTFSQMQAAQTDSQNQLFERLLEEQRRREDEEKERRREEREMMKYNEQNNNGVLASVIQAALAPRDNDNGGMSAILQIMQSQQNQTTQMIMEMNKNNMMMIQEMRRDSQQMMEKVSQMTQDQAREFRHQLSEMSNSKKEGFDAVEMFKMLNDTRESGMNFGLKINELAKQIAETDIVPAQPKGFVESVLDNLGKFAPLMAASQQQQQAAQYFAPQAPQAPVRQAPVVQKPVQAAKPVVKSTHPTPKTVVTTSTVQKAGVVTGKPSEGKIISGGVVQKPVVNQATTKTVVASGTEVGKIESIEGDLKTKVIEICVPLIAHALQNSITSGNLGDATLNALSQQGIAAKTAVSLLSVEDIYDIAFKKYTLPDVPELRDYLKDYHAYLTQKASA